MIHAWKTMVEYKAQGVGAQLQNILSQVELNKATAKKTEAEAEKIAGADTKVAEREAEMLASQSEFNRRVTKLQDKLVLMKKRMEKYYKEEERKCNAHIERLS